MKKYIAFRLFSSDEGVLSSDSGEKSEKTDGSEGVYG